MHDAIIRDLSLGGLKLSCNRSTIVTIIPGEQLIPGQISGVEVNVKFSLQPNTGRAINLQLTAQLIHTERLAQDNYQIGIQFIDMRKNDFSRLENYIEEAISAGDQSGAE